MAEKSGRKWLSRLFGRNSDRQLPAPVDGQAAGKSIKTIYGTKDRKQALDQYACSLRARYGHKFKSARYVYSGDDESNKSNISTVLYAFIAPAAGTWTVNRYDYVPGNGVQSEPVKTGLSMWEALNYVAEYENMERVKGKIKAEEELESEVSAPHYRDFATQERIPLDLDGRPLLVYEGEIVGKGLYDEEAVRIARMAPPPIPDAEKEDVRLTAQQAFAGAQMTNDDLQRIIAKCRQKELFESIEKDIHWLKDGANSILSICLRGNTREPLTTESRHTLFWTESLQRDVRQLDENPDLQDVKRKIFKPLADDVELEVRALIAKYHFNGLMDKDEEKFGTLKERRQDLSEHLTRIESVLHSYADEHPDLEENVRLYIMDRERPFKMPPSINRFENLVKDIIDTLHENIQQDNKQTVQTKTYWISSTDYAAKKQGLKPKDQGL